MEWYQIIAIFGALAWLPIIIRWFIRPKLSIVSDNEIEVGYDLDGPKLKIQFAFSSDYKDSLIDNMTLELIHKDQETHSLIWNWLEEEIIQITYPEFGELPTKKKQKAIAIHVPNDFLTEKRISFIDKEFKDRFNELQLLLDIKHNNFFTEKKDLKELRSTNEFKNFINLYVNSFYWKPGEYSISIKIHNRKNINPYHHKMRFQLTNLDTQKLRHNIESSKRFFDSVYITQDKESLTGWNTIKKLKIR